MKQKKQNILATGSVTKLYFKLAIPAVIAQVVNLLYSMVDRMYIGHMKDVGSIALAGIGIANPVIILITSFGLLVGSGGAPLAAMALGKGDEKRSVNILHTAFTFALILGLFLTVFISIFKAPFLQFLGASGENFRYAQEYLSIYVLGSVFVVLALGMNFFISVQGKALQAMLTVLIGAILNIILDPILIFTLNLGVRGAALATIISQGVSALWVLRFLHSDKSELRLSPKNMGIRKDLLASILALGFSPFIMSTTESLLQIVFNRALFHYGGDLYVATMSINAMVLLIIFLPLSGLSQGGVSLISYNYGAENVKRIRKSVRTMILASFAYSWITVFLILLFPQFFASLFTSNTKLIETTAPLMRIYVVGMLGMGIQSACQEAFIAFGQAKRSIAMALLRKIVLLIPMIYILPHFFTPQTTAVYMAEPIADFLAAFATTLLFYRFYTAEMKRLEEKQHTF